MYMTSLFTCELVYVWFCDIIGIVWGITKQIVTDVIGDYWKLFPLSWKYYLPPWASGNISTFGEMISNSDLNISNYLYIRSFIDTNIS